MRCTGESRSEYSVQAEKPEPKENQLEGLSVDGMIIFKRISQKYNKLRRLD